MDTRGPACEVESMFKIVKHTVGPTLASGHIMMYHFPGLLSTTKALGRIEAPDLTRRRCKFNGDDKRDFPKIPFIVRLNVFPP